MNKRILITGAAGFIGSYLTNYLKDKYVVTGTVHTQEAVLRENYVVCDWSKEVSLEIGTDILIHAAALNPAPGKSFEDFFDQNVMMAKNVIAYARKRQVQKIIFMAAVSSYGKVDHVLTEEAPHNETDDYGLTKYVAERLIESSGIPYEILILPGVVGPGCRPTWLVSVAEKIRRNETVSCYNADGLFNNVVDVRDVAAFVDLLIKKESAESNKYLLAAAEKMTVREVLVYLKERLHSGSVITELPSPSNAFVLDASKAQNAGFCSKELREILNGVIDKVKKS